MKSAFTTLAAALLSIALAAVAAFPRSAADTIVVNNADSVSTLGLLASSGLNSAASSASPRTIVHYANTIRFINPLQAPPGPLALLLGQAAPRVILHYANTARTVLLNYPAALVDDDAPPIISGIAAMPAAGALVVTWTTNEWATSTVVYGSAPGVYPNQVIDPLYAKEHSVSISSLQPGTVYYFKVTTTDRSGNTAASSEHSRLFSFSIHFPFLRR